MSFNTINRELIIALAARYNVPTIYYYRFSESGGLISYGVDFVEELFGTWPFGSLVDATCASRDSSPELLPAAVLPWSCLP